MRIPKLSLHVVVVLLLVLATSCIASAQATRTWVSGVGDDANPCSRTAPCKTFAGAISKTAPSGEIDCLDPGGFGAVTITKSITIDCRGGEDGGVLVAGTNGIVISANASTDIVTLKNMNIIGMTTGIHGVHITSAKAVHLMNLDIYEFAQNGVNVAVSATLFMTIEDTRIHECANGVQTNGSAAIIEADINRTSIWNTGSGVLAQNGSRLTVHSSTLFNNIIGVNQTGVGAQGSTVAVVSSTFTSNGNALNSIAGAQIGASSSFFTNNSLVFNANGGSISSANDNIPFGNSATGTANGPPITKI